MVRTPQVLQEERRGAGGVMLFFLGSRARRGYHTQRGNRRLFFSRSLSFPGQGMGKVWAGYGQGILSPDGPTWDCCGVPLTPSQLSLPTTAPHKNLVSGRLHVLPSGHAELCRKIRGIRGLIWVIGALMRYLPGSTLLHM